MAANKKKDKEDFKWTDDESELLLSVTHDYKVKNISENVDWESVKTKYDDILVLMRHELPEMIQEARENWTKDYPHTREQVTRNILTSKLKAIQIKYREAVDSGRRSEHCRVVLLFYELCEKIWGGSPATQEFESELESTEIGVDLPNEDGSIINESVNITSTSSHVEDADETDQNDDSETDEVFTRNSETIRKRKDLLDNKLSAYKHERMKQKLPVDSQLLSCAQEELEIKQKLVEQMDTFEKKYSETMTTLSSNMDKLAKSISDGFSLLKHLLMTPQPPAPYYQTHQFPQMYNHQSSSGSYSFPQSFKSESQ